MSNVKLPVWRVLSKATAKPAYFVPNLWKPWNLRLFNDTPRMRGQNLVFEIFNVPNTTVRKVSLVTRMSTRLMNAAVESVLVKFPIDKPEERSHKRTLSLAIWSLQNQKVPPMVDFMDNHELIDWVEEWDSMNDHMPTEIIRQIHEVIHADRAILKEIGENYVIAN